MQLYLFSLLFNYIICDTINYISPIANQTYFSDKLNVTYFIMRNGLLYLTDTTTELIDENNTVLSKTTGQIDNNLVTFSINFKNINLENTMTINPVSNYSVKITSSGLYNSFVNGTTVKLPLTLENTIPFTINTTSVHHHTMNHTTNHTMNNTTMNTSGSINFSCLNLFVIFIILNLV